MSVHIELCMYMVVLKGNLMSLCGQWVQHPRVIFVAPITSMWVPVVNFLSQEQPACNVCVF